MSHEIETIEPEKFDYLHDTYGGQSGSGIWINRWESPYVVGVHTTGSQSKNSGVRLSSVKFEKVIEWMSKSLVLEGKPTVVADLVSPFNLLGIKKPSQPPQSPQNPIKQPSIPMPLVAQGHEKIYERFLKGALIYRPNPNSDVGRVDLPVAKLKNPLESTFDLSQCGDTETYLSISTGYRKGKKLDNANKVEIWFAPRFLIEKELNTTAGHFKEIFEEWSEENAPVGIFWTWGAWDNLSWYDYLTKQSMDNLSKITLYENWKKRTSHYLCLLINTITLPAHDDKPTFHIHF